MAYQRDAGRLAPCWICGGPIDYQASNDPRSPDYSGDAWEPDHYWTPEQRPDLAEDMANLRPSHSRCNRRRGKEQQQEAAEGKSVGRQSREW